ncbi:MAG: inositol oxygenase, partial [Flavobacteriaceae bacterium]|nr:inositol oxygenase [Flavobacteriaceae bacterium]
MEKPKSNPLKSMDHWEDDLLERYPDPETSKEKSEFRNYVDSDRDATVREFYQLNH